MALEQQVYDAQVEAGLHQEPIELTTGCDNHITFLGVIVCFSHGSGWKLTKALTHPKYQQGEPPFEAR
ncbi:hypothetical protein BU25DRAFT_410834 [Macroventuria anomochaeta]|uniref:Uncharacterized protein n=1 Tax=Macroventuria anomochaeta TaxID=301207 RepID=A0ACB6S3C0_9PLEO|nr:uncharacterized protein BU25DRAFT_410834 [Macroventuria anomochaeta]KAF2627699.1 hypothetical protein BU25DRAFT_410834 [Macroventuria anomochaeta]